MLGRPIGEVESAARLCSGVTMVRRSLLVLSLLSSLGFLAPPGAEAQDELIFDDAFLVIQLENEVTARSGRQPSEVHYRPQIRLRFFGPVSSGDAVKIRWRKGRRTLAEIRCPLQSRHGDWRTGLSQRCWNRDEVQLTAHGDITADVIFVDDSADEERTIRTLQVPVGRYWAVDRTIRGRTIHSPRYQVRGDDLLGLSYIWFREPGNTDPYGDVYLYFWATLANDDTNYRDPSWRCTRDGELAPELSVGDDVVESLTDIRVTDDQMRGRSRETTHYAWRLMWVKPEWIWGTERNPRAPSTVSNSRYNISEHPGEYVCQLRNEGEMVRTFRFTITEEGTAAPHPAQTAEGGVSLRPGAFFVETGFPRRNGAETSFDRDAVRRSVAFGRAWPDDPAVRRWLQGLPPSFGRSEPRPPRGAR